MQDSLPLNYMFINPNNIYVLIESDKKFRIKLCPYISALNNRKNKVISVLINPNNTYVLMISYKKFRIKLISP